MTNDHINVRIWQAILMCMTSIEPVYYQWYYTSYYYDQYYVLYDMRNDQCIIIVKVYCVCI